MPKRQRCGCQRVLTKWSCQADTHHLRERQLANFATRSISSLLDGRRVLLPKRLGLALKQDRRSGFGQQDRHDGQVDADDDDLDPLDPSPF